LQTAFTNESNKKGVPFHGCYYMECFLEDHHVEGQEKEVSIRRGTWLYCVDGVAIELGLGNLDGTVQRIARYNTESN
jgi:hypothetical protein